MLGTASMNGVIKITKRSLRKFQFGEDEPIIVLDIIAVSDEWHDVSFALRVLENEAWVLPPGKLNEFCLNRLNFVQGLVDTAYVEHQRPAPKLTRMEAEEFIRAVVQEAEELRNFTSPKSGETSSAPESTEADRGVNFSQ